MSQKWLPKARGGCKNRSRNRFQNSIRVLIACGSQNCLKRKPKWFPQRRPVCPGRSFFAVGFRLRTLIDSGCQNCAKSVADTHPEASILIILSCFLTGVHMPYSIFRSTCDAKMLPTFVQDSSFHPCIKTPEMLPRASLDVLFLLQAICNSNPHTTSSHFQ